MDEVRFSFKAGKFGITKQTRCMALEWNLLIKLAPTISIYSMYMKGVLEVV